MGVDGDLIRPSVPEIVEIRNGCICCATQDQLAPAIRELVRTYHVDILMVEMSGVPEPLPVLRELQVLAPLIDVRSHVVLVDGTADPDRSTRDRSVRTALEAADVVAITKIDFCRTDQLEGWSSLLGTMTRTATIFRAARGDLPLSSLLDRPRDEPREPAVRVMSHGSTLHRFTSVCRFVAVLVREDLADFVRRHGAKMDRIKGIARVDGIWSEVQVVRSDLQIRPFQGLAPKRGRLVFISRQLYRAELLRTIDAAFDDIATFDGNDPTTMAVSRGILDGRAPTSRG
ncbi:CobW family GTP-binding protein [Bradyrhizobium prioriisuperbiae]|uniref:CobW family GTP-binding protein n=1 Tax=Bradyrhizobium prioriisuperbiae TaxID=2854389 RepID=UPI0028E8E9D4|nr:GTP-binding protein [Bradyrhizobium prioritasuperba]